MDMGRCVYDNGLFSVMIMAGERQTPGVVWNVGSLSFCLVRRIPPVSGYFILWKDGGALAWYLRSLAVVRLSHFSV